MNLEVNLICLVNPFFLYDQKVDKNVNVLRRKELLRRNKDFSSFSRVFNQENDTIIFGR